jgi:RHS repeat-associated protein
MKMGGSTYYLSYDQVGSLRLVADASGNVVKRIGYDSFGNILEDTNPSFTMPFGFAGGLHDRDTGLVRFGYRDYDPEVGRWTAKDPIWFAGGDTDLYGYVLNDPVNAIDPYGLILRPGAKFVIGKAIRPIVNGFIDDPSAQRIITSGIAGAITGIGAGIIGGAIAGGAATGPLAGVGAVPGAIIGGISGFSTGLSTGLLYGVIYEITGIPNWLEDPCP